GLPPRFVGRPARRCDCRIRTIAGGRRPHHQLCGADPRWQCRRSPDRAILSDHARAHQRNLDRALVLHPRAQPHRGRRARRHARLFGLITNTLAKDKEVEDRWRGFPRPISSRNLSNFVEDEVVDALIAAVRASYPELSHRYYRLKARWFGVEKLPFWDRNAPL